MGMCAKQLFFVDKKIITAKELGVLIVNKFSDDVIKNWHFFLHGIRSDRGKSDVSSFLEMIWLIFEILKTLWIAPGYNFPWMVEDLLYPNYCVLSNTMILKWYNARQFDPEVNNIHKFLIGKFTSHKNSRLPHTLYKFHKNSIEHKGTQCKKRILIGQGSLW